MMKVKLNVAHEKCLNCGTERILYFTHNYAYGERIVSTKSGKKWPNCLEKKMIEDKALGEQLKEVEICEVTHNEWERLDKKERKEIVNNELLRQGYLIGGLRWKNSLKLKIK